MNTTLTYITTDEFHKYKAELWKPDANEYVWLSKEQKQ